MVLELLFSDMFKTMILSNRNLESIKLYEVVIFQLVINNDVRYPLS